MCGVMDTTQRGWACTLSASPDSRRSKEQSAAMMLAWLSEVV